MPHLVWTARPDGTVDYYNEQAQHYAGLRQLEDGTWQWSPVLHPDDVERTAEAWRHAVETGEPYEVEHRARMADGSYRWHVSRALPFRGDDGRIERWCGTATDIHHNKETEAALRKSESRFRALFMETRDAILLANDEGVYTDANPEAVAILGYEREELLEMTVGDLSDADPETFRAMWNAFLREGRMRGEYPMRTKQGELLIIEFNAVANVLPGQHLSTLRDVTERVQAEEALQESERRVRKLARALTLAEQRERRRIALVLHEDLQQLLGGARMLVPSRPGQTLSAERTDTLQDMLVRALEVTRTLSHELSPPLSKNEDLGVLLRWLAELKRKRYGMSVEVEVRGAVSVPDESLRVLLYQFVRELLFNVVKHAKTDRVRVVAEQVGARVRLTVADEGAGFDPAILGEERATGLGLSSVRERLELVGGRLEVTSVPGHGTRVTVDVPVEAQESA